MVIPEFQSSNQLGAFGLTPDIIVWDFLLATNCPVCVSVLLFYWPC